MTMKLRGLTPALKTTNMQRTIDFYVNVLGFTAETVGPPGNPTLCFLCHGDVRISFMTDENGWYAKDPLLTVRTS